MKLGVFVGENNWTFFEEIYQSLSGQFETNLFQRKLIQFPLLSERLNRLAFHAGVRRVMQASDVCYFEWASDLLAPASYMPKTCAIVTRLHSFELFDWAPRINWERVDRVILVSRAMQRLFCEHYPRHADKTIVIYNGQPLSRFHPPEERTFRFELGMLCNVVPVKRVYDAILSFHSIAKIASQARLRIAGKLDADPRYAAAVQQLVVRLGLEDRVIFDGFVADTPAWLREIDIFISNSYWEGQQVALLEAMASGCYCLSHDWSGAEEMLPASQLFSTSADLEKKVVDYADSPAAAKHRAREMMREIATEKFNIDRTISQIIKTVSETGSGLRTG